MCTHANIGDGCPKIMSFVGIWQHLMGFASGGRPTKEDPAKRIEIKKMSILFKLEYWKVLELLKLLKFLHELRFHST
jgi:hypothetical protein